MDTNKTNLGDGKDFATTGTESFELQGQGTKDKPIVLNIQDDSSGSVLLDTAKVSKDATTGNPITDLWRRINRYFIKMSGVKVQDKATFFHLLSVMVNAGIPMLKALRSLKAQTEKSPRLKMVIETMIEKIESGSSLSETFDLFPDVFTEQEIGMVQSGEASGRLSKVLQNLAEDTEKSHMIKKKVKSAMTYPSVIFVLLILVVSAMMILVIPQLTDLFNSTGEELPLITNIVVGISNFMLEGKYMILAGMLSLILIFLLGRKTKPGRYLLDKFKISVPIFGKLFKKAYLARFARSLSSLLDSNVSYVRTLQITADAIGNVIYKNRLILAVEDIKQGIPLAENLADSPLFPPMLVNMIEVGEQTAQLDTITAKLALFYEEEVDTAVAGISKIIEPVILIVIGLTVGAVVAAIILPIMKLVDISGSI